MPASPTATPEHIKDVNTRYHDAAADEYDAKWGIDFGETGQEQVRLKLVKALGGRDGRRFGDALEIGSGTGYFSLNLVQLGADRAADRDRHLAGDAEASWRAPPRASGSTTSPPSSPRPRRCPSRTRASTSSSATPSSTTSPTSTAPSPNSSRVLRPGGSIAFAGEPSRYGDRLAALPKRTGILVAPAWRRRDRRRASAPSPKPTSPRATRWRARSTSTPSPPPTCAACSSDAGFEDRRVGGEELLANAWGWGLRTVESSAEPDSVPCGWRNFAFRSYIALQKVDTRVLEPHLPAELFYNLLVSARKPA